MIQAKLQGKLGNQLFITAAAIGYHLYRRIDYSIAIPEYSHDLQKVYGTFYKFSNVVYAQEIIDPSYYVYNEPSFEYAPIPYYNDIIIKGGFQSYKYFYEYKDLILNSFSEIANQYIRSHNTCSIHVRRGDYLNFPNHHPTTGCSYYEKAIDCLLKLNIELNKITFKVFSDDIEWCKKLFTHENFPDLKFEFVEETEPIKAMILMSRCEHNIIANSTFSWWAAYFNKYKDKKVIAPKEWFGKAYSHFNTKDLIPKEWITI